VAAHTPNPFEEIFMKLSFTSILAFTPVLWACGASIPPPTQRMADAQAAERSALELGANGIPAAQLSVKLAQQQIAEAQKAMTDGDNAQASRLLVRAKADAEVAVALAREKNAKVEGQKAVEDSAAQKATNVGQGAAK